MLCSIKQSVLYSHVFELEFCQISEDKEIQICRFWDLFETFVSIRNVSVVLLKLISPGLKTTLSQFERVRDKKCSHPKSNIW